jgi:hypothetical protein
MKHEYSMATRNPQAPGRKPGEVCTDFQLHKSQIPGAVGRNLFDYTEFRLNRYIQQVSDDQQKSTLLDILAKYKKGLVAVAWKAGKPVWIAITKESKG